MPITRLPLRFPDLSTTQKAPQPSTVPANNVPPHTGIHTGLTQDLFFKGNSKKSEATPVTTAPQAGNPVHRLVELGAPGKSSAARPAFYVSEYFSNTGRRQHYDYGDLLRDSQVMAAGYLQKGLGGKRIAIAETNSLQSLSSYYGGLAAGATMVPLNLLALQDEGTKASVLGHMISGPQCEGFVFGQDPLFNSMQGFKKILKLKNTPGAQQIVQNYLEQKPARSPMAKLIYHKLNKEMDHKLSAAVDNMQQKGITPTDQDKRELAAKIRTDFKTLYEALPKQLTLISPEVKAQMVHRKAPLALSAMETRPNPDALAEIIFTSGTSGNPKGVGKTHGNMAFTTESVSRALDRFIGPDDTILLGLPMFHIFGKAVMLTGMNRQIPMVLLPSLSAALKDKDSLDNVMKTIRDHNVTVLPAVPIFLEKLVDHAQKNPETKEALKNLRVVLSGGSALKKSTYDALKAINPDIKILEGYGSSEGGINTLNASGHPGLVGSPLKQVEVKLIQANEQSGKLEENEDAGEIWVRSPGVSSSYVEGTVPQGTSTRIADEKGFYRTGDQGRHVWINASSKPLSTIPGQDDEIYMQQLQIMGRESNFIKDAGGERRAPEEFESAVKQADPRIADAMAVAHKPNRETEKSVVVAVTNDPSVTEGSLKKAMSIQVATGKIPGALVPKHIVVLNRSSLPDAFKNEFKREAGYKAAKSFVEQAISRKLIQLQDKSALSREKTVVLNDDQLQGFAEHYQYAG